MIILEIDVERRAVSRREIDASGPWKLRWLFTKSGRPDA